MPAWRSLLAWAAASFLIVLSVRAQERPRPAGAQVAPSQRKVIVAAAAAPLDPEQLRAIAMQESPPVGLTRSERSGLRRVSERLRHKNRSAAQAEWERLIGSPSHGNVDVDEMIRYVLNATYVASDRGLGAAAERARLSDERKTAAHARRVELEQAQQTVDSVAEELQRIVVLCNHVDEESERANRGLAKAFERRQQTVQAMSMAYRSMHDAAKGIVNNVR